jgi:DNA transformation protein and related proteins
MKNIGKVTAGWLNEVGIHSLEDLQEIGSVEAYRRVKAQRPRETTIVLLYALEGALLDCHWNALPADVKASLREQAED